MLEIEATEDGICKRTILNFEGFDLKIFAFEFFYFKDDFSGLLLHSCISKNT